LSLMKSLERQSIEVGLSRAISILSKREKEKYSCVCLLGRCKIHIVSE